MAEYADGIGPDMRMIVSNASKPGAPAISDLVAKAHRAGLVVHPYTFRADKGQIPRYARNFEDLLDIFYRKADVDGVFTDFPDRAVQYLRGRK